MRSTPDEAAAWSASELDRIGQAEELQLASRRQDGTLRPLCDHVGGPSGRRAVHPLGLRAEQPVVPAGHGQRHRPIRAGGAERDVTFTQADEGAQGEIDDAYHAKYDRYGPQIVGSVVGGDAHKVTIRLVPAAGQT